MIRLPVSIGEAIDKLTILDIKCKRIEDPERRKHCQTEYDILFDELKAHVDSMPFYYKQLYTINDEIWVMQDEIRARPDPQKCVDILDKNDMRFRIKDVINQAANSHLREQKGYPTRRAIVIGHMGLGDHIGMIGAVRYIAMQYDETVVVCKRRYAGNVASFFADNPTIKLWLVDGSYTKNPTDFHRGEIIDIDPSKFTGVYRSGFYTYPRTGFEDLPQGFYKDMGIGPEVRHTHFHVPTTNEALDLYARIQDQPYIFVQQMSSSHTTNLVTWDIDSILTIDPNINVYSEGHRWHPLAQTFVNREFLSYLLVIQNAKEIHTVDSSFYCLACYVPLKADVKRCYARETGAFISTYTFT
jgi:hypothetical protein